MLLIIAAVLSAPLTYASVVINGTRFIYNEKDKEITVKLTNNGDFPVLIQSWLDKGNQSAKPDNIDVPFAIYPPINRINARQSKTIKIRYTGAILPSDRESVFWLNVHEVPVKSELKDRSYLQFAFRSRLKLFYRPASMAGKADDAQKSLVWSCSSTTCEVKNNSGFYVSLVEFERVNGNRRIRQGAEMISPYNSMLIKLNQASSGGQISYTYLNDWGAIKTQSYGK